MRAILLSALLLSSGCTAMKAQFVTEPYVQEDTTKADVTLNCQTTTNRAVGPHGIKGVFTILSGYGSINQIRGEEKCVSEPYTRKIKNF